MAGNGSPKIEKWTVQDSTDLYGVNLWGKDYFAVDDSGHLQVHPDRDPNKAVDLLELVEQLRRRGINTPVLARFPEILKTRLEDIRKAFDQAIKNEEYQGEYSCIYPIKVNQQAHVVYEYLEYAAGLGFGIEAGSKPELLAVLALVEDSSMPIVCNGFKDEEFIETVVLASKIGMNIIPIVENFTELELITRLSQKHQVKPRIGMRVKLASRGVGRWEGSAGIKSKFGLTIPAALRALDYLKERNMEECLQLLHFHMGSQVSNIRRIKAAISEAARIYTELKKAGANMKFLDVGGGLGVDYDGSQTNYSSSVNYTLEEYANDVIYRIKEVCDEAEIEHPNILSESGRAIISYHSVLLVNVLGRTSYREACVSELTEPDEDSPAPLRSLYDNYNEYNKKTYIENYHDAVQAREEAINLFNLGYLTLQERALAESLFWAVCEKVKETVSDLPEVPDDLSGLDELMAETLFCNFSLFQSLPDSWAIGQLFPIMPIHRLDEEPESRGLLVDITCDSDGKIDRFVDRHDVKKVLEIHDDNDQAYYLGIFLLGAYQEILGDLHNLLGDTNAVHVSVDEEGELKLKYLVEGDTVSEVLEYVQFEPRRLIESFRGVVEKAVKERRISLEESAQLTRFYIDGMNGYTYLEDPHNPSLLSSAVMPAVNGERFDSPVK